MTDTEITRALRDFLAREFPKDKAAITRLSVEDPLASLGVLDSILERTNDPALARRIRTLLGLPPS